VGIVEGGTSVNTIAQSAAILCEYRSTDVECLSYMKKEFFAIFDEANNMPDTKVEVECVGERPCADKLDMEKQNALAKRCKAVIEQVAGVEVGFKSSSTDCNIPLSLGIPAVCVGVYTGGKVHTREEFIFRDSLPVGLEVGISVLLDLIK
jgi:di/tripeptidase